MTSSTKRESNARDQTGKKVLTGLRQKDVGGEENGKKFKRQFLRK